VLRDSASGRPLGSILLDLDESHASLPFTTLVQHGSSPNSALNRRGCGSSEEQQQQRRFAAALPMAVVRLRHPVREGDDKGRLDSPFFIKAMLHELGHALGLGHSGLLASSMFTWAWAEQSSLGCDDQQAIWDHYHPGEARAGRGGLRGPFRAGGCAARGSGAAAAAAGGENARSDGGRAGRRCQRRGGAGAVPQAKRPS
jgi:hypothetical protein